MKKLQSKLEDFQVEKLEERKEFTFYWCNPNPPCGDGDGGDDDGDN